MLGAAKVIRAVWRRHLTRDRAHAHPKPLYGLVFHGREGTTKLRSLLKTGKEKTKPPGLTSTEKTPMNSYRGEKRKKGSNSASDAKKSKEEETRNVVVRKRRKRRKGCGLARRAKGTAHSPEKATAACPGKGKEKENASPTKKAEHNAMR